MVRSKAGPILILAGAGGALLGTFLPWVKLSAPYVGTLTRAGIQGDGVFLAVGAVVAGIIGLVLLSRPANAVMAIGLVLAIIVMGAVVAIDFSSVQGKVTEINAGGAGAYAEVGEGLYLCALAVILTMVGCVMCWPRGVGVWRSPPAIRVESSDASPAAAAVDLQAPSVPS
jgi:hypothetical protein